MSRFLLSRTHVGTGRSSSVHTSGAECCPEHTSHACWTAPHPRRGRSWPRPLSCACCGRLASPAPACTVCPTPSPPWATAQAVHLLHLASQKNTVLLPCGWNANANTLTVVLGKTEGWDGNLNILYRKSQFMLQT